MKTIRLQHDSDLLSILVGLGYSKTKAKQLVKHRAVSVGDRETSQPATRSEQLVRSGETVSIRSEQEMREEAKTCPGLSILYEDEAIIVIDKPAGLLTIATEKEKRKTAFYLLSSYLKEKAKDPQARIFIVHRLDQGTSGLLVFAKSEGAKQILQEQWEEADKRYSAVVEGVPRAKVGQIASTLAESKALRVYTIRGNNEEEKEGKEAKTNYQVVKESADYALLDISLLTGRKNQIRVHLSDLGHPIVGDKKYGAKTNPLRRMALHAYYLSFNHPTVPDKRMEFKTEIPGKFHRLFVKKKEAEKKR